MYTELESSNGWPWFVVGLTAWIWCSQCMAEKEVASSTNLLPLRWMQLGNPCSHGLNRCNREVQKLYGFKQHTFGEKSTPVEVEVQVVLFFLKKINKKLFFMVFHVPWVTHTTKVPNMVPWYPSPVAHRSSETLVPGGTVPTQRTWHGLASLVTHWCPMFLEVIHHHLSWSIIIPL